MSDPSPKPPLVWDLPTRLFHWLLVILIIMAWVTADLMHDLERHALVGQAILALILFRILWGFVGGRHARFSDFIRSPMAAISHLKDLRRPGQPHEAGHNAAGGWMVLVLLGIVGFQAGSGLFVSDGILFDGPLYGLVSSSTAETLRRLHNWNFTLIQIAVALHILAVLVYLLLKRQNLIRPMLTGRKPWLREADLTPPQDRAPALWRALICGGVAIVTVRLITSLG